MRVRKILATAALALSVMPMAASAAEQYLKSIDDVRKVADAVASNLGAGKDAEAWKLLKPISVFPAAEFEVFESKMAREMTALRPRFGAPIGYGLVREDAATPDLIRITYIVKYENAPMRWFAVFYKSSKGWVVTDFVMDGRTLELFRVGG